jgi:CxxC motif-containing protein
VKTSVPIPKEKLLEAMSLIGQLEVTAPVSMGAVLLNNLLGTGADLVACKTVAREEDYG